MKCMATDICDNDALSGRAECEYHEAEGKAPLEVTTLAGVRSRVSEVRRTCFDEGLATCNCVSCLCMRELLVFVGLAPE